MARETSSSGSSSSEFEEEEKDVDSSREVVSQVLKFNFNLKPFNVFIICSNFNDQIHGFLL